MTGLLVGADGLARCPWVGAATDYVAYHDDEWGRPVHGDAALYERVTLEGFQSGLSWLTILRKRAALRTAFAGFDPALVAAYGEDEVARLLGDRTIVRNRAKIEAAVHNARAVLSLGPGGLDALFWSYAPGPRPRPATLEEVPASTPASLALTRELTGVGFRFVGPRTVYAAMQAMGLVDDHVQGCSAAEGRAGRRQ